MNKIADCYDWCILYVRNYPGVIVQTLSLRHKKIYNEDNLKLLKRYKDIHLRGIRKDLEVVEKLINNYDVKSLEFDNYGTRFEQSYCLNIINNLPDRITYLDTGLVETKITKFPKSLNRLTLGMFSNYPITDTPKLTHLTIEVPGYLHLNSLPISITHLRLNSMVKRTHDYLLRLENLEYLEINSLWPVYLGDVPKIASLKLKKVRKSHLKRILKREEEVIERLQKECKSCDLIDNYWIMKY